MIYGKQYGIQIKSRVGEYTCVKLQFNKTEIKVTGCEDEIIREKDV